MNAPILPVSFDIAGAAAATGISAQMIRRAINAGDLRPHYVEIDGRQVDKPLIRFAELDRWVEAGKSERKKAA